MATAPILPVLSVEEYLRSEYEPYCEYLDGVLEPKALPDYLHSKLQKLLLLQLAEQEEKLGLEILPELHIRVREPRYRIPDLSGLNKKPADGRFPNQAAPPLFTIEIVSLEESWPKIRAKITDHLEMGTGLVIVADPYNKTVIVVTPTEPLHEIGQPLLLDVIVPDAGVLQIDFAEAYRQLSRT